MFGKARDNDLTSNVRSPFAFNYNKDGAIKISKSP